MCVLTERVFAIFARISMMACLEPVRRCRIDFLGVYGVDSAALYAKLLSMCPPDFVACAKKQRNLRD